MIKKKFFVFHLLIKYYSIHFSTVSLAKVCSVYINVADLLVSYLFSSMLSISSSFCTAASSSRRTSERTASSWLAGCRPGSLELQRLDDGKGRAPVVQRDETIVLLRPPRPQFGYLEAAAKWETFATQNYFDPRGRFTSVVLSTPLVVATLVILVNLLLIMTSMMVEVAKRRKDAGVKKTQ